MAKIEITRPTERTLAEVLERRAADMPDHLAFCYLIDGEEGPRFTYAQLAAQARAVAAALRERVSPGDRAVLLYAPGLDFIPAFFGCMMAGVIAVPAYPPRPDRPWHSQEVLSRLVQDCTPSIALTGGPTAAEIRRSCEPIAAMENMPWVNTSELEPRTADAECYSPTSDDWLAYVQYTSGSTGNPKGVMVSHGNVMQNEWMIAQVTGHLHTAIEGLCGLCWLPFQHDLGLVSGVMQGVYVGGPVYVMSPMGLLQRPIDWLRAVSRYKAYTSGGPNFAYNLCVRRVSPEQRRSLDLSHWKIAGIAAEPVRIDTINRFSEAFAECGFDRNAFYPTYGLAEATLMVTGPLPGRPLVTLRAAEAGESITDERRTRTLVGCGGPWLDTRVAIVDPETRLQRPPGEVGEIWVQGRSVAQGYWGKPKETAETFQARLADTGEGPFLRTGDLGFFRDNELFIAGRLKDLLVIRGQNHYPEDIEHTAQQAHEALKPDSGAAFQVETDELDRLVLVQEIDRLNRQLDIRALTRQVRKVVADRHGVDINEVLFVRLGTLPKTPSGKVRRQACKAAFLAGEFEPWQSSATSAKNRL